MTRILFTIANAATIISLLAATVTAQTATGSAAGAIETLDCYSSAGSLDSLGEYTFQTSGYCQQQCAGQGKLVMATSDGSTCLCGDSLPPASAKVDSSKCNRPCNGFDQESCGGDGFYQVYLTGLGDPDTDSAGSSPTSGSSSTATSVQPSVITKAGQTIVVTASATSSADASSGGGGPSKVGIAVGVVVGVLALAAIIGVVVFVVKRRRNRDIEEEHRRNAAVSSFVGGPKSDASSATDSRLDPKAFHHRRESVGSIADERDFSRRILQVRNPDRESKASQMA